MAPATRRVDAFTLAREEIRSLPRSAFALGTVGILLALLAPFAALVLDGPDAFREYLIFLWIVAELAVAIVLAARIASARRTRFVDSLYTTPLEARAWLAAQLLVGAFLASLVLVAQVPFILVHLAFVGAPPMLGPLLLSAVGVAAFAVALGAFCGVIVGDSGGGAAAGLAGGIGFLSFILFILHGVTSSGPTSPLELVLLRLSALSPLALVVDATALTIFGSVAATPWRAALGLAALVMGLGGAAWLAYTRAQGPLGWERGGARAPIVALVALALIVPVASANVEFHEADEESSYSLAHGEHTRIAFVAPGTPIGNVWFTRSAFWEWEELVHGRDNEVEALVMLLVDEGDAPRNVRVDIQGTGALRVVSGGARSVPDGAPDGHAHMSDGYGEDAEPVGPSRPVYRVPVVLRPEEANALIGSRDIVEVHTTFVADGRVRESDARLTLESNVAGAQVALVAAGAPLPLAALAALATRRIQTR